MALAGVPVALAPATTASASLSAGGNPPANPEFPQVEVKSTSASEHWQGERACATNSLETLGYHINLPAWGILVVALPLAV